MIIVTNRKIMPPTYFWIYCVTSVLTVFIPVGHLIHFPFNLTGVVLIAVGLLMTIWVEGIFKRVKTTVKPFQVSSALVTTGPFRFSRNPMYLGMVVIFLGIAIVLGTYLALIGAAAFIMTINLLFIPQEEVKMEETFGFEYAEYRRRVRRWI